MNNFDVKICQTHTLFKFQYYLLDKFNLIPVVILKQLVDINLENVLNNHETVIDFMFLLMIEFGRLSCIVNALS